MEYKSGALLEISDKFSNNWNVFSFVIFQFSLNCLQNIITALYDFGKEWLFLLERTRFVAQNLIFEGRETKLSKMEKAM